MKTNTKLILQVMNIIFWIIFIGLCIETGALLISFFVSLFINGYASKNLYLGLNMGDLKTFSLLHYILVTSFVILIAGLKAYIAYLVIKIFLKFNLDHPFSKTVAELITKISYVALGTGLLGLIANGYTKWLIHRGATIDLDWGSTEFLYLAGIIFIIAHVFKKGTEIQSENDLTV